MDDLVILGGPSPRRFAEPVGRPIDQLCPWAGDLSAAQAREFYAEVSALMQKWHERALGNTERSLGDLAAI